MTKYEVIYSSGFKKDVKRIKKRGYKIDLLISLVEKLANGEKLSAAHRDHALTGKYTGYRECHITPDWLLIYQIQNDVLVLVLAHTGTHSDLF